MLKIAVAVMRHFAQRRLRLSGHFQLWRIDLLARSDADSLLSREIAHALTLVREGE
jgi:hypothetical protein